MGSISILFFDNVFVILNNQNFIVLISKKILYLTRFYAKTLSSLFFVFFLSKSGPRSLCDPQKRCSI